ncbi:MAG: GAF domain-containing protein [Gammaproteobacteria bacterium]|nr:GAF domain-containing protein [Gammaproteobacteria bacterium]
MDRIVVEELSGITRLIEQKPTLEDGLRDLAALAARSLGAARCSVMLLSGVEDNGKQNLKVCSHFGDLPDAAYQVPAKPDSSIACHVVSTGEALLVNDVQASPVASLARQSSLGGVAFMSAPIITAERVIGVINVSRKTPDERFSAADLELLKLFSLFVGKSIHVFQLEKLSESRLLQMAQVLDARESGSEGPITPDPARIAKIVAKSFYRELSLAGFGPNAIIAVATEVLGQLNENLQMHRERIERSDKD